MSKIIDNFYNEIHEFIRKSEIQDIDRTYDRTVINQVFSHISEAIQSFQDCTTEEDYRTKATSKNGNLATIQYTDPITGYKLYQALTQDNYKEFYYECLMYALIHYELFFKNYKYSITSSIDDKFGDFEITEEQIPHMLGIESKFIGNCQLLDNIIDEYSSKNKIEQLLALVENHKKIMEYENNNHLDIFNYYKSMQKVKEFLLLGRFFNGFENTGKTLNIIEIENNPDSNNQIWLTKKTNLNSNMNNNIIKLLLQKNPNGMFFVRSLQATCDTIHGNHSFCGDVANNYLTVDIPQDLQPILINAGLILSPPDREITLDTSSQINPAAFWKGCAAGTDFIKQEEFQNLIDYLNIQKKQIKNEELSQK